VGIIPKLRDGEGDVMVGNSETSQNKTNLLTEACEKAISFAPFLSKRKGG
jgi:hypothetical protein